MEFFFSFLFVFTQKEAHQIRVQDPEATVSPRIEIMADKRCCSSLMAACGVRVRPCRPEKVAYSGASPRTWTFLHIQKSLYFDACIVKDPSSSEACWLFFCSMLAVVSRRGHLFGKLLVLNEPRPQIYSHRHLRSFENFLSPVAVHLFISSNEETLRER